MSKLADFYREATRNPELESELLELNEKYKESLAENNIREKLKKRLLLLPESITMY